MGPKGMPVVQSPAWQSDTVTCRLTLKNPDIPCQLGYANLNCAAEDSHVRASPFLGMTYPLVQCWRTINTNSPTPMAQKIPGASAPGIHWFWRNQLPSATPFAKWLARRIRSEMPTSPSPLQSALASLISTPFAKWLARRIRSEMPTSPSPLTSPKRTS